MGQTTRPGIGDAPRHATTTLRNRGTGDERAQAVAAVERTVAELGRLDTVVSNAGVMLLGPALESSYGWPETVDELASRSSASCDGEPASAVSVLSGAFYCCRAAIPHLRQRPGSAIVNISSSDAAAFLASDRAGFITGQVLLVDGGRTYMSRASA